MRTLVLVVVLALAAGCVATPPADDATTPAPPAQTLYAPDCGIVTATANWTEPCVAHASPNPSPGKTEIDVVVNPKDPMNVVVGSKDLDKIASDCVWAVPQVSHDGGKTWKTVYIGGKKADRDPGDPLFTFACVTDPILAFNKDGILFYTLQAYDTLQQNPLPQGDTGSAMFLARSKDGGDTWDKIIALHAGEGNVVYHDYIRMASNPKTGSVYSVWNQLPTVGPPVAVPGVPVYPGYAVPVLVATRDGGETAAPPVYIPLPENPTDAGQSAVAVDNDGRVYVVIMSGANAYLATSTDDAQTFAPPTKMFSVKSIKPLPNTKFRAFTFVELAIDRSSGERAGCLHAVWTDASSGEGNADILSSRSCDKGKSWSNATRVNRDNTRSDQFMTRVVVDDAGTVHVVYFTRAYDAENRLLDAEHAYSTDGGVTWATKRLTQRSFDGDLGVHQNGSPFIGDYIGIDSAGGRTYAAFPHTGTGVAEIAVAAITQV